MIGMWGPMAAGFMAEANAHTEYVRACREIGVEPEPPRPPTFHPAPAANDDTPLLFAAAFLLGVTV